MANYLLKPALGGAVVIMLGMLALYGVRHTRNVESDNTLLSLEQESIERERESLRQEMAKMKEEREEMEEERENARREKRVDQESRDKLTKELDTAQADNERLEEKMNKLKEEKEKKWEEKCKRRIERQAGIRERDLTWQQMQLVRKWWGKRAEEGDLPENSTLLHSLEQLVYSVPYWNHFKGGEPPVSLLALSGTVPWWQTAFLIDWMTASPLELRCKDRRHMGNWGVCMDPPYTPNPPCLVYSFGIAFDFSFDDAMGKHGCEVHSFDPSMNTSSHKRNENVMFHNLGISNVSNDNFSPRHNSYVKDDQKWQVKTLDDVMADLGHTNKTIDVLKIDVELNEWPVVKYLLDKNILQSQVRQFLLEWHIFHDAPPKESYPELLNTYQRLKESGFEEYQKVAHPRYLEEKHFNIQADTEFVNTKFKASKR